MSERSSKKQRELLNFVDSFIKGHGYGPSYREIMKALGYKSVSTVAVHIDGLIQKGYLNKRDKSARSLEVLTVRFGDSPKSDSNSSGKDHEAWLDTEIQQLFSGLDVAEDMSVELKNLDILIKAAKLLGFSELYSKSKSQLDKYDIK